MIGYPGSSPVTTTLRQWVEHLVTLLPIRHVADLVGLHWHIVKTIDKQCLQRACRHWIRHACSG